MTEKLHRGDLVEIHTCFEAKQHKGQVFKVMSEEEEKCGQTVVFLKGIAGCFATKFLRKVQQ